MLPNQKIQDGSYKMYAFLNDRQKNSLGLFELVVRNGVPHALVSTIPTTAGEEKLWKVLDTNHLEPAQIGEANYFCREILYLPSDLESMWRELYGHVRPFVHTEGNGMRFVAAGNRVFYSDPKGKPWKYVADFLKFFAEQTLGRGWILDEIKKPEKEQHQIIKFHWALHGQLHKAVKDEQGDYGILPCGSSNYFYNLAYDLFVLQDNGVLFDSWLHRLKNKNEFQGVRHEIFAAATCIRAGFKIAPDQSVKPTEFIATHINTGLQIAVEAKSRQRKDVLDVEIGGNTTKADIIPLLNRALKKTVSQPYVIFVDLNLPFSLGPAFQKKWFQEIHSSILPELGDSSPTKRDEFNMVVFTNHPWHYGENNQPSPPLEPGICLVSKYPERELTDGAVLNELMKAVQLFGNIPNSISDSHAVSMAENKNRLLVRRPANVIEKVAPGSKRILSGMVADILAVAHVDLDALVLEGKRIQRRQGMTPEDVRAFNMFHRAAVAGHTEAKLLVYECYLDGHGVREDVTKALEWFHKSAESGFAEAQRRLADFYQGTHNSVEAVKWFRKAAEQGDVPAECSLGLCYYEGEGVQQNYAEAVKWVRKAAERGDIIAQKNLGVFYDRGHGVAQNDVEAVRWYQKAAEQGDAGAQNDLGVCYETGQGVLKNHNESVKWYRKAADQGNAEAISNLSRLSKLLGHSDNLSQQPLVGDVPADKQMDYSPLNDACWSSTEVRTEAMLPLIAAFKDWREWDQSHVKWTVEQIAIQTVKRIIAEMDCLPENTRNQCRKAKNTKTALEAAQAANDFTLMELAPGKTGNREAKWAAKEATDNASWAAA